MSASTEKKLRKAAREAGTNTKEIAAREEALKKAKSKRKWTVGTIAVILLCAVIIFLGSGILYKTTAVTIADEDYTAAETNYYIGNQFQNFVSQNGTYASLFGLDTSLGVGGLSEQSCLMLENGTWKDYFMQLAEADMVQMQALCDYAEANGIALTEEEIAEVESSIKQNESYVKLMGYNSVESFYTLNYGHGVNSEIAREVGLRGTLANKVIDSYRDSLNYSDALLEKTYADYKGEEDMFNFAYYYVPATTETVVDENGEEVSQVAENGLEDAKATAEAIEAAYLTSEIADIEDCFNDAINLVVEGDTSTRQLINGASLSSAYKTWLMGSRNEGDISVIANNTNGYYVVLFLDRSDNHYNVAQVRHILVKAEAENGEYTKAAKAEALKRAEEILGEWKGGEATEESFATMAALYSADTGSKANGGLYDTVLKGQTVEEFDAFCFEGHEPGDTAIVYGESDSYAGYHVMYYVGEGDMYSNIIAESKLLSADLNDWIAEVTEGYTASYGFGYRFVA